VVPVAETKICYFTFATTHLAIRAEKEILSRNLEFKMVPVPRSISSSCGTALRCLPKVAPAIRSSLEDASIEFEGFYEIVENSSAGRFSFFKKERK
jgi:hypothetical protein